MELHEITRQTLKVGNDLGVDDLIVRVKRQDSYQYRFANNVITISKMWNEIKVDVFFAVQGHIGTITIENPSLENIKQELHAGLKFSKNMQPSPFYKGITTEPSKPRPMDLYDKRIETYPEQAGEDVQAAINEALTAGAKRSAGLLLLHNEHSHVMTNHGFDGEFRSSHYEFNIRSFWEEDDASGQDLHVGRDFANIKEHMLSAARHAGELSKQAAHPVMGKKGQYDVIFSPIVAANILNTLATAANPISILMGFSPYKDKIGSQITPEFITITDNGLHSDGLGTRPFDMEGNATQTTPIIENGVLKGLIHSTSTAKLMGGRPTGNTDLSGFGMGAKMLLPSNTNIEFPQGDHSLQELFELSSDGRPIIYVTSNWYTRWTSMVEGTFSSIPRDAMLLIENGEITGSVKKLRISDNLLAMAKRIQALGNDKKQIYWWECETPTFIPSVRIQDVRFTSATN